MISIGEFAGTAPRIAPSALAEDLATEAANVGFDEGVLTGALCSTLANSDFAGLPSTTRAIARPTASSAKLAFTWHSKGGAFANLLAPSDVWGRVYYLQYIPFSGRYRAVFTTKDHYSETGVTIDPTSYWLGIPEPWRPPMVVTVAIDKSQYDTVEERTAPDGTVSNVVVSADIELDMQKTAYVYTIVDAYGHEGVPSNASDVIDLPFDAPFRVDIEFAAQTLPLTNMAGGFRRLYRAAFDGSTSEWQFVADVPWTQLQYSDYLPLGQEGEAVVSADWAEPPFMEDLAVVNGAFLASFEANRVSYSAYLLPHAWPESTRFPLPHKIVAIKSTLGGLFIGTKGTPYWASGADPAAAVPINLGANYPCLSSDSVVDMGGYVIYASHDGLVSASADGVSLVSAEFVDRLRWLRDFAPGSIKAFGHEGDYYFSVGQQWWVFSPSNGRGLRKTVFKDIAPGQLRQVFYDAERDTTMLLRTDGAVFDIVSQQDSSLRFTWLSKEFRQSPVCYSTGQVLSTEYPVTLIVEADGEQLSYEATSERPFRLSAIGHRTRWRLGVNAGATARVMRLAVSQSPTELLM